MTVPASSCAVSPRAASPRTVALARAFAQMRNQAAQADLLFLEAWEMRPCASIGAALRAQQVRRANPALAAAIRAELSALA